MEKVKQAILDNFMSETPYDWSYDRVIKALSEEEEHEELAIWEPYEDWGGKVLADHIVQLTEQVEAAMEVQKCHS